MSRENIYLSIILKKQAYGEGDELVTVFTQETGKLRGLAKSTKFSKSKLQYGLQVLFLTKLTVTASKLPKIIGTEVVETFPRIRENLESANVAFYVLELLLKFTPDEEKNEQLFYALTSFFRFLNAAAGELGKLAWGLAKFKIEFLNALGFSIHADPAGASPDLLAFSNRQGGFLFGRQTADSQQLNPRTFSQFNSLATTSFPDLLGKELPAADVRELQEILSGFILYHLERDLKSERFL